MKEYFVKAEDGTFIKATDAQVKDPSIQLHDQEGKEVKREASTPPPSGSNLNLGIDAVKELTGLISDLVVNQRALSDRVKEIGDSVAAYKAWQSRSGGLPLPLGQNAEAEAKEKMGSSFPYDLALQGKGLSERVFRGKKLITEEKRIEIAKYFVSFLKAAVLQIPGANSEYRAKYGSVIKGYEKATSTDLGDTGNVFPVPNPVESEILGFAREDSVVLQFARIWDMISEKQTFPAEVSSPTVSWGSTTSESNPAVGEVELSAVELSAYSAVRNTTLQDTRSDIVTWLTELMAEAVGQELDNVAFNDDTTKLLNGLLITTLGNTIGMGVQQIDFTDLTATHLSEMIMKLPGKRKRNARYFFNGEILHLIRTLKDKNDRPIFVDTVGSLLSPTIWNYPYSEVLSMPALSDSAPNTPFIIFGDLQNLAVGRRVQSMALEVNRLATAAWTGNKTWFKIYQRWGMKIGLEKAFVRIKTGSGS